MSASLEVIAERLDLLIADFQRFRNYQEEENKDRREHSNEEDKVQARILTELKWHRAIGASIVASLGATWIKILSL